MPIGARRKGRGNVANFLTDTAGRKLTPGSSEGGIGADINEQGQYVVSTNYGTMVGDLDNGTVANFVTDAGGRKLTPGSSEGGIGAGINEDGQFVASTNYGTMLGRVSH